MKVVATFHPSSSVVSSLKCHLTPDTSLEHLVVAKINRIDVFSTRPEGLKHECGVDVWGRISALKAIASTVWNDIKCCKLCFDTAVVSRTLEITSYC